MKESLADTKKWREEQEKNIKYFKIKTTGQDTKTCPKFIKIREEKADG